MVSFGSFCLFVLVSVSFVCGTNKQRICPHHIAKEALSVARDHPTAKETKAAAISADVTPIVFVYTLGGDRCSKGFHDYMKISVEQAILTQVGSPVILASNYGACNASISTVRRWHKGIIQVDTDVIRSNRTREFVSVIDGVFVQSYMPDLWGAAALRFFILEDIMSYYHYQDLIHVEADNLLYGNLGSMVPLLRAEYPGLAVTPVDKRQSMATASVLWVGNSLSLYKFNSLLLNIGRKSVTNSIFNEHFSEEHIVSKREDSDWLAYIVWLRQYACCKTGGIDPENTGKPLKPFSVNEMTMLAYYKYKAEAYGCPSEMMYLPVVPSKVPQIASEQRLRLDLEELRFAGIPAGERAKRAEIVKVLPTESALSAVSQWNNSDNVYDKHAYMMIKSFVGASVGEGSFDPASWGQYLGGTHGKRGKDRGFSDKSHILFEVIWYYQCIPTMKCSKNKVLLSTFNMRARNESIHKNLLPTNINTKGDIEICYTAATVNCGGKEANNYLLWNVHIHSKNTWEFKSIPCDCDLAV